MFDHLTIRAASREASERFYDTVLEPLGAGTTLRGKSFSEWDEFGLAAASDAHPVTSGLHVAFLASTREHVDAFWQAGIDAGHPDDGAPGERPQYHPGYYGAFLRDPDGNSIEAVHGGASTRDSGQLIDHVWLRTTDLRAITAFYTLLADSAGLVVRYAEADRSTFAARDGSGSFSFVPGDVASRNVHMAFAGTEEVVRAFHANAVAAGYRDHGGPGERPEYHPGYYGAYVLDPDGHNIEVVDHHR
ncbi:MAG: hypothetical protein JHC95_21255 [Solirubrobacteraceae bacterium]|nr:hypothetical protein [Solirubrobacteraceae bacterium]